MRYVPKFVSIQSQRATIYSSLHLFISHTHIYIILKNLTKNQQISEEKMDLMDKAKNFVSDQMPGIKKPEASITDMDLKEVHRNGVDYLVNLCVTNPYSHSVPICDIKYTLKSANREIVSGTVPDPGSLRANDKTMLEVRIKVPHSVVATLIKDMAKDWDIDYFLELGLVIDLPVIGNFTIPLSHKGEMKLPTIKDMF